VLLSLYGAEGPRSTGISEKVPSFSKILGVCRSSVKFRPLFCEILGARQKIQGRRMGREVINLYYRQNVMGLYPPPFVALCTRCTSDTACREPAPVVHTAHPRTAHVGNLAHGW